MVAKVNAQMRILFLFFPTVSVFLLGCNNSPPANEIPGYYEATYSFGTATLHLLPNNSYTQTFRYSDGRVLSNSGTWEFSPSRVRLHDALFVADLSGRALSNPSTGDWRLSPMKQWGRMRLGIYEDIGLYFEKKY